MEVVYLSHCFCEQPPQALGVSRVGFRFRGRLKVSSALGDLISILVGRCFTFLHRRVRTGKKRRVSNGTAGYNVERSSSLAAVNLVGRPRCGVREWLLTAHGDSADGAARPPYHRQRSNTALVVVALFTGLDLKIKVVWWWWQRTSSKGC